MTDEEYYASRFVLEDLYVDADEKKRRAEIRELTLDEHRASIGKCLWDAFPFHPGYMNGKIDWELIGWIERYAITDVMVEGELLSGMIRKYCADSDHLLIFWPEGGIPSLKISSRAVADCALDVIEATIGVWIYDPTTQLMIESMYSQLTIGRKPTVPVKERGPRLFPGRVMKTV